ncbi:hypothetical protein [Devosia alba]|uniref:hypothetical protein n=1 Tax=Devosia alba TaxID=3152360 RepID=UPI003265E36A
MAAVVGALRVDLGLNSAEFSSGLKKASSGLGNFAKTAKIGLAAVAVAAAAAGTALAFAVKGAIDNADEMSKTAQKVGVTTEALSQLNYAASLSDVTLEQLSKGLGRLTQSMSQIAQGMAGPAKMAFDALGISAVTSTGHLRASDDVLGDVAERFARMEDGATKTALAIALFGRSGADLIPMLNMGKSGLADLATEADRLGITLSTNTGRSAEAFNDSLTRLQSVFAGVINRIMTGILPALDQFSTKISDPAFAQSAETIGLAIVNAMGMAVEAINATVSAFTSLQNSMSWLNDHDMFGNPIDRKPGGKDVIKFNSPDEAKNILRDKLAAGDTAGPGADFYKGMFGESKAEVVSSAQEVAAAFDPLIANTKAAAAGASALSAAMSEGKAVFEATRTPAESYGLELERLNALLAKGAIDQDTYNRAVTQAQDAFRDAEMSGNQLASTLSSGLANVFSSVVDGSKTAVDAIGDLLKSLGQLLINQAFTSLIGGLFGGGGGLGGFKLPSFDGGGYTGPGSGPGLDGKGGFLAMLHPNETVLDHSKGQGMGTTIQISIRGSRQDAAEIAREVRRVLPDAMASVNRNPYRRT